MRWPTKDGMGWHRWVAWHPVVVDDHWVWLESIERCWSDTFCGSCWIYRYATSTSVSKEKP